MNANKPDQSRGKKVSSGHTNKTEDKESMTNNKNTSQVDHIGTQHKQTNVDINLESAERK